MEANGAQEGHAAHPASQLSDEEAALYDRQIRLWGADAQQRLREARVLLAGFGGILTEVCKNVVLAGVNRVTILDDQPVRSHDLAAQFFLREEDVGHTREAVLERIQLLNPQAVLSFENASIGDKDEAYLRGFNVVCMSMGHLPLATIAKVNALCRRNGIPFYATDSYGYRALFYADLAGHRYVVEEEKPKDGEGQGKATTDESNPPAPKRQRVEKLGPPKTGTVAAASQLAEIVKVNWAHPSMRRVPKLLFALAVLYQWRAEHEGRYPVREGEEQAQCVAIKNALLRKYNLRDNFLTDEFMLGTLRTAGAELSPICAITGGILGQQVIKVITAKGEPEVHNVFFYDARTALGVVETISV